MNNIDSQIPGRETGPTSYYVIFQEFGGRQMTNDIAFRLWIVNMVSAGVHGHYCDTHRTALGLR
jgi:hypothetical protein